MQAVGGKGARLREVKPIIIKWLGGNPSRKGKGSNHRKNSEMHQCEGRQHMMFKS